MKGKIRVLAVDDGHFTPKKKGSTILVGIVFCLDGRIDGIITSKVRVDGFDGTEKLIKMCNESRFSEQIQAVLLDGVNFAGFNVVDLEALCKKTGRPVLTVFRKMPRFHLIEKALLKMKSGKKRFELIQKAGKVHSFKSIFFQCHGITPAKAKQLLGKTLFFSNLPEPLRIAHIVASAVTLGESTHP